MDALNGLQVGILVTGFFLASLGGYTAVGYVTRWSVKWMPVGLVVAMINGIIYVVAVKEIMGL